MAVKLSFMYHDAYTYTDTYAGTDTDTDTATATDTAVSGAVVLSCDFTARQHDSAIGANHSATARQHRTLVQWCLQDPRGEKSI